MRFFEIFKIGSPSLNMNFSEEREIFFPSNKEDILKRIQKICEVFLLREEGLIFSIEIIFQNKK